jgi:hypothetical protein
MPEDVFGTFEQLLASENPSASFDFLFGRFRAAKDYRSLFEARLMKKRLELGLPLFLPDDLSALPSELREAYVQAVTEAARDAGELFLSDGEIAQAWPYLKATGDSARVADAIERVASGDGPNRIIEIALQEGVHPATVLELIAAKYGICRAPSAFEVSGVERDREKCIAVLARKVHSELVQRLGDTIEQEEGSRPASTSIAELIVGRDWLFGEYSSYVDSSHLVSSLQHCPEVPMPVSWRSFTACANTGSECRHRFVSRVNRHFEGGCIDFDHYSQALLGNEVESQLAHFRRKAEEAAPERVGSLPAQALVGLLARVARYDVALDLALTQFPRARAPRTLRVRPLRNSVALPDASIAWRN